MVRRILIACGGILSSCSTTNVVNLTKEDSRLVAESYYRVEVVTYVVYGILIAVLIYVVVDLVKMINYSIKSYFDIKAKSADNNGVFPILVNDSNGQATIYYNPNSGQLISSDSLNIGAIQPQTNNWTVRKPQTIFNDRLSDQDLNTPLLGLAVQQTPIEYVTTSDSGDKNGIKTYQEL